MHVTTDNSDACTKIQNATVGDPGGAGGRAKPRPRARLFSFMHPAPRGFRQAARGSPRRGCPPQRRGCLSSPDRRRGALEIGHQIGRLGRAVVEQGGLKLVLWQRGQDRPVAAGNGAAIPQRVGQSRDFGPRDPLRIEPRGGKGEDGLRDDRNLVFGLGQRCRGGEQLRRCRRCLEALRKRQGLRSGGIGFVPGCRESLERGDKFGDFHGGARSALIGLLAHARIFHAKH